MDLTRSPPRAEAGGRGDGDDARGCDVVDDDATTVGSGYVLLESCAVAVVDRTGTGAVAPDDGGAASAEEGRGGRGWIDVRLVGFASRGDDDDDDDGGDGGGGGGALATPADDHYDGGRCCPRCTLTLTLRRRGGRRGDHPPATSATEEEVPCSIDADRVPRFDGTVADARIGGSGFEKRPPRNGSGGGGGGRGGTGGAETVDDGSVFAGKGRRRDGGGGARPAPAPPSPPSSRCAPDCRPTTRQRIGPVDQYVYSHLMGQRVAKRFPEVGDGGKMKVYMGSVAHIVDRGDGGMFFLIEYTDGDSEHVEWEELQDMRELFRILDDKCVSAPDHSRVRSSARCRKEAQKVADAEKTEEKLGTSPATPMVARRREDRNEEVVRTGGGGGDGGDGEVMPGGGTGDSEVVINGGGARTRKRKRGDERGAGAAATGRPSTGARNRSDASLLVGLALRCRDLGYVRVDSMTIILGPNSNDDGGGGDVEDEGGGEGRAAAAADGSTMRRAALLLEVSVRSTPIQSRSPGGGAYAGTVVPPPRKRARRSSSSSSSSSSDRDTPLPPEVQLLLAMLRCDFDHLQSRMEDVRRRMSSAAPAPDGGGKIAGENRSLFPIDLSLEEVYGRILGAGSRHRHHGDGMDQDDQHNRRRLPPSAAANEDGSGGGTAGGGGDDGGGGGGRELLSLLPDEILLDRIVPHLRARSVHRLRRTCRRLDGLLRSTVPGLRLRLFRHQVASLEWMRGREEGSGSRGGTTSEADILGGACRTSTAAGGGDDVMGGNLHGACSGGATVLLRSTGRRGTLVRLDGRTGRIVDPACVARGGSCRLRRVARGGLLCDDPGLGKTITVLSLVLQTFGQSTEDVEGGGDEGGGGGGEAGVDDERSSPSPGRSNGHGCPAVHDDEVLFRSYWREGLAPCYRADGLRSLVNKLRKVDVDSGYFEAPVDPEGDGCPDYRDVVSRPMCFRTILAKIGGAGGGYGDDFDGLFSDVDLCFSNAMLYNPPDHEVHRAAERLSRKFRKMVAKFKREQAGIAKRAFSSVNANPDSAVAAMLAERAEAELLGSLHPSSATLLIVPNVLLKHWQEQIINHVDFRYCTGKIPLVFYHRKRGAPFSVEQAVELCTVRRTHFPLMFVDEGASEPLPEPDFLAMFSLVVTTSQRIISEWKFGSVEQELNIGNNKRYLFGEAWEEEEKAPASALLKVHWLRLVVDEGHTMGRGTHSNTIQFASWITAQRRWAMTGTPSRQTASQNGLRNILGLVRFLRHDFFSPRLGGDRAWGELIARPWSEGRMASFFRLRSLLSLLMVRHTKRDIAEIPPPRFLQTYTVMGRQERISYNTLVSGVHTNIKTTSMKGKRSGWQDSLLNPRQSRHATLALNNVRLACCGGTYVLPQLTEKHWIETIQYLRHKHHCPEIKVTLVNNYLRRATAGELSSCMVCGLQLQTLFVVPCGDLVCTECIDSDVNTCPVCEEEFDVDDFQLLQPGMVYEWKLNLREEEEQREREALLRRELSDRRSHNPNGSAAHNEASGAPLRAAPQIELPPIGAGDDQERVNEARRQRRRKLKHQCNFSKSDANGKCLVCQEEHFDCNFMIDGSRCSICYKVAEECPPQASKAFYVTQKLLKLRLAEGDGYTTVSSTASHLIGEEIHPCLHRPLKVIVFSQFRQLLDYVGDRLIRRFGGSCVAEYWGTTRSQELEKFVKSPSCFCMLLGKEGSHGLDLSFVTNIILLDELWDKSIENQVVARAYRMGATGCVEVEKLVARDSIEELMSKANKRQSNSVHQDEQYDLNDDAEGSEVNRKSVLVTQTPVSHGGKEKQKQQAKLHYLLKNVSLVRNLGSGSSEKGVCRKRCNGRRKKTVIVEGGVPHNVEIEDGKCTARVRFAEPTKLSQSMDC